MTIRLKQSAVLVIGLLAAAQLIRPDLTNPPTDVGRTIEASAVTPDGLAAVLDRSCRECHSNRTVWPWYSQVAPVSWLMVYGVKAGRNAVNFSEWSGYSPDAQRALLAASCEDVKTGKMPGAYAVLDPGVRLSERDVEVICRAAVQSGLRASHDR